MVSSKQDFPPNILPAPDLVGYGFKRRKNQSSPLPKFGEITAPRKSWIHLTRNGAAQFIFLAHDAQIDGYACRGGGHDYSTALYPDGKLKTCWLAADSMVNGIPCMRAGFVADVFGGGVETDFHENGHLKGCKLSRDATIGDRTFHRGDHIRLDETGQMAKGLSRP